MTRIHLVSLPHTLLTRQYDYCAYTAKLRRFVDMLVMAGNTALVYGPDIAEENPQAHYFPVVHEADRLDWFGTPEWDTDKVFDRWDAADVCWTTMNERAIAAISENWETGDVVGIIGGRCQQSIADHFAARGAQIVEWGIGYSGVLNNSHKVFESYAWMHHVAGYYHRDDIAYFDSVIPNCFATDEFTVSTTTGDYLLYMGRPNPRKGLAIIEDIAKRTDIPVLIAGQPGPPIPNTEYVGLVLGEDKKQLLAGARALLSPTVYLEPFGGVAVEAMMSGTPVIATDWGAFTETVIEGYTGFRCRMLRQFLDAVDAAADLNRSLIAAHATRAYSTEAGAARYATYMEHIETLRGAGWYAGT